MGTGFRYCVKEMTATFVAVTALLIVVSLGARFTGYLQEAAAGRIAAEALGTLIALRLPEFLELVLPFALVVAVLVTWGRIHADREHAVLVFGGMGPRRSLMWLLGLAVPVAVLVGTLSLAITPYSRAEFVRMILEQRVVSEFDAITPREFRTFSGGKRVTFVEGLDREQRELHGVLLIDLAGSRESFVWAEKGRYLLDASTGTRFFVLESGIRTEGMPGDGDYRKIKFDRMGQRIEAQALEERIGESRAISTAALDRTVPEQFMEWHWRLAMPILTLLGAFCALGISRVPPRSGRFGRIVPGLLIFVIYYVAMVFLRDGLIQAPDLTWIGLWPVHLAFLVLGVYLYRRSWRPT